MNRPGSLRLQLFASALTLGLWAASCTAILGIDKDYREGSGGAGGSGAGAGSAQSSGGGSSFQSVASSSASASSSSSGAGGSPVTTWHSWDVKSMNSNPPQLFVLDTNGQHQATILPYQSKSLLDLGIDTAFVSFNLGLHPDMFSNVQNFWTPQSVLYPYVGKSTVGRGGDSGESNAPLPLGVYDLQLFPPTDTNKLVVAAFECPLTADYAIEGLSARRVAPANVLGDHAKLRVFVGNMPVGPTLGLQANKDQGWVNDPDAYDLGVLGAKTLITFAVDSVSDNTGDATEIAWTIDAL